MSCPISVVIECATLLPLVDLVVLADAVFARPDVDAAQALRRWREARGPHAALVRQVVDFARVGAESPAETRTRMLVALAGLPELTLQYEAVIAGRRRRFDLAYPELKIALEYDGSYHFASEAQKQADILREEEMHQAGWIVIRVVSHGLYRDPASTVTRVARALAAD